MNYKTMKTNTKNYIIIPLLISYCVYTKFLRGRMGGAEHSGTAEVQVMEGIV